MYVYRYMYIYIVNHHHCRMDDPPMSTLTGPPTQAVTQDGHALRYASPQLRADPHFAPPGRQTVVAWITFQIKRDGQDRS